MPIIREYVSQVRAPGAADLNLPTPQVIGLQTARAKAGFVKEVGNIGDQIHKLQVEREASTYLAAESKLSIDLTQRLTQGLANGSAANPEFVESESRFAQEQLDTIIGGMNTREASQFAQRRGLGIVTNHTRNLIKGSAKAVARQQRNQLETYIEGATLTISQNPLAYDEELEKFLDALHDSPAFDRFSPDEKQIFETETKAILLQTAIKSMLFNEGAKPARDFLAAHKAEMTIEQYDSVFDWLNAETSKEDALAKEVAQNDTLKKIRGMTRAGGDPRPIIDKSVEIGMFTAEQADSLRQAWFTERERMLNVINVEGAFADDDRVTFEQASKKERDAGAANWLAKKLQEIGNTDDEQAQAEIMTEVIRKGTDMDYVFPQIEAMVQLSPMTPGFGDANDLYEAIKDISPAYASRLVSDKQAAWHDAYQISRSLGGLNDEQARDIAMQMTDERMKTARGTFSATKEDREDRDDVLASELGSETPWIYKNMILDYGTILKGVHPTMTTKEALERAVAHFTAGHVDLGDGLWAPKRTFASIPENRWDDVMDRLLVDIPEMLHSNGILVLEGEYKFVPDQQTEQDGRLILLGPDGLPPGPFRFGAQEFLATFGHMQREKFEADKIRSKTLGHTQVLP